MPRVKYLGKGNRILAVSGLGVIHLVPNGEVNVDDRVAYRMLEANRLSRKPLYEFLDLFPSATSPTMVDSMPEQVLPKAPETISAYLAKTKSKPEKKKPEVKKPKPPQADIFSRIVK